LDFFGNSVTILVKVMLLMVHCIIIKEIADVMKMKEIAV
jgi:hypothetical protein